MPSMPPRQPPRRPPMVRPLPGSGAQRGIQRAGAGSGAAPSPRPGTRSPGSRGGPGSRWPMTGITVTLLAVVGVGLLVGAAVFAGSSPGSSASLGPNASGAGVVSASPDHGRPAGGRHAGPVVRRHERALAERRLRRPSACARCRRARPAGEPDGGPAGEGARRRPRGRPVRTRRARPRRQPRGRRHRRLRQGGRDHEGRPRPQAAPRPPAGRARHAAREGAPHRRRGPVRRPPLPFEAVPADRDRGEPPGRLGRLRHRRRADDHLDRRDVPRSRRQLLGEHEEEGLGLGLRRRHRPLHRDRDRPPLRRPRRQRLAGGEGGPLRQRRRRANPDQRCRADARRLRVPHDQRLRPARHGDRLLHRPEGGSAAGPGGDRRRDPGLQPHHRPGRRRPAGDDGPPRRRRGAPVRGRDEPGPGAQAGRDRRPWRPLRVRRLQRDPGLREGRVRDSRALPG